MFAKCGHDGFALKVTAMTRKFFSSPLTQEIAALKELAKLKDFLLDHDELTKASLVAEVILIMRFDVAKILLSKPAWPDYSPEGIQNA